MGWGYGGTWNVRTMRKGTVRGLRLWVMGLVVAAVCVASAEQRAVKSRVSPVYPEVAKRMRISGVVKLEASVDPDGKVTDVKTVSGNHMLSVSAEDAVRKWKFASASAGSTEDLDIKFDLQP